MPLAVLGLALMGLTATAGCVLEPNPDFIPSGEMSAGTNPYSADGSTRGTSGMIPPPGSGSGSTGPVGTSQSTSDPPATSHEATEGSEGSSDSADRPVDFDAVVIDLAAGTRSQQPQLAWSGRELGVSWDEHRRFVRLMPSGDISGLPEMPIDEDARYPDLTFKDGEFFGLFRNNSSHVVLQVRESTDSWTTLGRKDDPSTTNTLGSILTPLDDGLLMAWRENTTSLRWVTLDAEYEVIATDEQDLAGSYIPERLMVTEDRIYTLARRGITPGDGPQRLFQHGLDLTFTEDHEINDRSADLARGDVDFGYFALREAGLVLGRHDGRQITAAELELIEADPGTIREVRLLASPSNNSLMAWRTEGPPNTIEIARLGDDTPLEVLELDDQAEFELTDLISIDSRAAVGWGSSDGPRVAIIDW